MPQIEDDVVSLPLSIEGVPSGVAKVYRNGGIELSVEGPNELGRQIIYMATRGLIDGLNLKTMKTPTQADEHFL